MGAGSSPLTRGSSVMGNSTPEPRAVYPRWRGEHPIAFSASSTVSGLSPLARGTRQNSVFSLPVATVYPR